MRAHNLPPQPTSFVGRREELAEIAALLADARCRLLVLVGPGGIGKTRLALEAAAAGGDAFRDGVYFVPLQSVAAPEFIVPAMAQAVGFAFHGRQDPREQLFEHLRSRQTLLVMDNLEHLLPGADLLATLLAQAPEVKLLVTSREVLGLREEWVRAVRGLDVPPGDLASGAEGYSAVQLFAERARQVNASFSLEREGDCAAAVCRLVEGMPLAIELAAAWLRALPCAEVAREIQRSLDFLSTNLRNVPERHRNVRAVFEQTWNHLPAQEQEVFRRLSAFRGGLTREAAAAVAGASVHTLQALVDRSLLAISPTGRYEMHELLRQYAAERLAAEPEVCRGVHDRHCSTYAGFLADREVVLKGADQIAALAEVAAELDNVRAAWSWAVEHGLEKEVRDSLGSLHIYYQVRSLFREAAQAFDAAVERFQAAGDGLLPALRLLQAWFYASGLNQRHLIALVGEGVAGLRAAGRGGTLAMALAAATWLGLEDGSPPPPGLEELYRDNLAAYRRAGDRWGEAWSLYALGSLAWGARRDEEARDLLEASRDSFLVQGDRWGSTYALHNLGLVLVRLGEHRRARETFQESLRTCRQVGDRGGEAFSLHQLGHVAFLLEDHAHSMHYLAEALRVALEIRDEGILWHLYEIAVRLARMDRRDQAVEILSGLEGLLPPSSYEHHEVQKALDEITADMTPGAVAEARRRSEGADLDALAAPLLAEFLMPRAPGSAEAPPGGRAAVPAGAVPAAAAGGSLVEPLSPRELEVLALLAAGHSNADIARELVVTVGTVKKHVHNLSGKLQAGSRTQAIARARALGLLE
jgi:predicted ATPase/DNA-binding CsgD family transcriptional regulator